MSVAVEAAKKYQIDDVMAAPEQTSDPGPGPDWLTACRESRQKTGVGFRDDRQQSVHPAEVHRRGARERPESALRRLKQYSGRLATEAVHAMEERLPFFADLEASQRASVQLVVQTAVVNFVEWMRNPQSDVSYTAQAFEVVPQDLRRRIALRQSVEMVRVTMEFFEEVVPLLARSEEQLTALTAGILRYSRDLAFAAASAYADQAEIRGAWDTRMEANLVDAVVRGDTGPDLQSQAAALNWDATAPATVLVGAAAAGPEEFAGEDVHDVAKHMGAPRCPTCTAPGWSPSSPAALARPTAFSPS